MLRPLFVITLLIFLLGKAQAQTCPAIASDHLESIKLWKELLKEVIEVQEEYFKTLFRDPFDSMRADQISEKFAEDYSVAICPSSIRVRGINAHKEKPCYVGNPRYRKLIKYEPPFGPNPASFTVAIEKPLGSLFLTISPQIIGMRKLEFRKQFYEGTINLRYGNLKDVVSPLPAHCEQRLSENLLKYLNSQKAEIFSWIRTLR